MRKPILTVICFTTLLLATVAPTLAAVNCGIVNKDLKMGRKPEDIAERMGITVADVQTCKQQGSGTTAGTATAPKTGSAPTAAPAAGGQAK